MPFDGGKVLTPVAEHLIRAKELIERDGWCSDGATDVYGARCALVAIFDAGKGRWKLTRMGASRPAVKMFMRANGIPYIDRWNDTRQSIQEIYAAFDRAISLAMEEDK